MNVASINALIAELTRQRNEALDRCAVIAGDCAALKAENDDLKKKLSESDAIEQTQ